MKRYLAYFSYVIRHKWFVFLECCGLGIPWPGAIHDLSKLLPSELLPYAKYFYNPDGSSRQIRDETGYYKPTDTGSKAFDFAWFLHQKRNWHHWQWWVLPLDGGGMKILPMSDRCRREMLADWRGAGRAQGTPDTGVWYRKHRKDLMLHPDTREWIEKQLDINR